ncbi:MULTISPECIES: hypothetical protein [Helicobacter]|nr:MULTISPECIES: hypothetical protein [Helicobacter]MDY4426403.1 hypothetical protein [Helicobacter sp.]
MPPRHCDSRIVAIYNLAYLRDSIAKVFFMLNYRLPRIALQF